MTQIERYERALKMIKSCQTAEQLAVCDKWILLLNKEYGRFDSEFGMHLMRMRDISLVRTEDNADKVPDLAEWECEFLGVPYEE